MNLSRLKKFQDKISQGNDITIAFHGGSVTSGICLHRDTCFPALTKQYFEITYPNINVNILDFSDPGRPSTHGLYTTVTKIVHADFDVIFLEFAINDIRDDFHQMCFEAMVNILLTLPCEPLVVPLLSINKNGYSCSGFMKALANHYDLPVVSIGDALNANITQGKMSWDDYSADISHPSPEGNQFIFSLIKKFLTQKIDTTYPTYHMPAEPFISDQLTNINYLGVSWNSSDSRSREFTFTGELLLLIYLITDDDEYGTAEVMIDNKKAATYQSYRLDSWPHEFCEMITLSSYGQHTFNISMIPSEQRKKFTLIDVGIV